MPALLETQNLVVGYGKAAILSDVQLSVNRGEIVAILGRNGAGKTTLLHTIGGVIPALSGLVSLDGRPSQEPLYKQARAGLGLIPETRGVVHRLTVQENLRLGGGDKAIAFTLFPELKPLVRRRAGLLSGGEQQMLAIGRTLASRPRLLLIDELSLGLAPIVVRRLLAALREAVKSGDTGILLVEQHIQAALSVADRVYVLGTGGIRMSGTPAELKDRQSEIEAAYLV
jgi:branched-chain amino acid transport system ATP-binding protein